MNDYFSIPCKKEVITTSCVVCDTGEGVRYSFRIVDMDLLVEQNSNYIKHNGGYYRLESSGDLTLCHVGNVVGSIHIPRSIMINEKEYFVTKIGSCVRYIGTLYHVHRDKRRKEESEYLEVSVGAFYGTKNLVSCHFPSSVKVIEPLIWGMNSPDYDIQTMMSNSSKTSLREIYFEDNKCDLESIEEGVFNGCPLDMDILQFPEGLRRIGANQLSYPAKVNEIILPSTIESIGYRAFGVCHGLKRINLPDGLKDLGDNFIEISLIKENINIPQKIKDVPVLEWDMSDRFKHSRRIPCVVIHNRKKDVFVPKETSKYCTIKYVDENGKCKTKRRILLSINYFFPCDNYYSDFKERLYIFGYLLLCFLVVIVSSILVWLCS